MSGSAYDPQPEPIIHVQEGMRVVDRAGENVGTVELVKLGDPQAVTARGQAPGGGGIVDELKSAFGAGEPQVPDELAARLMRLGFVKVDGRECSTATSTSPPTSWRPCPGTSSTSRWHARN